MKISLKLTLIILFISFFVSPSLAIMSTSGETQNRELPENYTGILVQMPQLIYQPVAWNEKFSIPTKGLALTSYGEAETEEITQISGKSLSDIASTFGGSVFLNNSEYAYAYIKIPNDNYENLTSILKLLGFDVRNISWGIAMMNETRLEMGLPYTNLGTGQQVTGRDMRIAVLDTGIDPTHQDFSDGSQPINSKVIFWKDEVNNEPCCKDLYGHGTAVASAAAGTGAASGGVYKGVAPDAQLLIFRISLNGDVSFGVLANAINDAVNQNPDVISLSYGWKDEDLIKEYSTSLQQACAGGGTNDVISVFNAIQNAIRNGIPFVVSAGNEGPGSNTIAFPACLDNVIAVGMNYKRDYADSYQPFTMDNPSGMAEAQIHAIAGASGDILDKEWNAFNSTTGENQDNSWRYFTWSGFTKVFSTLNPTFNLKMEGQYKTKNCQPFSEQDAWNPGSSSQGDMFWTWGGNAAPYGGMEVYVRDHTTWGYCFDGDVWGTTYINSLTCSGTPKSCGDFNDKSSCQNQLNCSWCGCYSCPNSPVFNPSCCIDVPQSQCKISYPGDPGGEAWWGCNGTAASCQDPSRSNNEGKCGTTATTGCSGQWAIDDTIIRFFNTTKNSLKGVPASQSSRGPSPIDNVKPDVTAPGFDVCAAKATGTTLGAGQGCANNYYTLIGGTSFSAPAVAGEIALLKEIKPDASLNQILDSVRYGSDNLIDYVSEDSQNERGYGAVNISKAADAITNCSQRFTSSWQCVGNTASRKEYYYDTNKRDCEYSITPSKNCDSYDRGYSDNIGDPAQCSSYDYNSYSSANQMRDYSCSVGGCFCNVTYDSFLNSIRVNALTSGDATVNKTDYINVDVAIKNTGVSNQSQWYLGLESYNVSDFNDPGNTRDYTNGRINAFYNGKDGTHGCILKPDNTAQGYCPSGVDCKILSESINANGILEVGETIMVECKVPAWFYPATTGNQRIMFWVHERDLGQDAGNDGNGGNTWWADALTKSRRFGVPNEIIGGGPADIKVKITPNGGYQDSANDPPKCQNYNYGDYTSANQMRTYTGSNCNVTYDSYITNVCIGSNCENYDSPVLYYKFDGDSGLLIHDSSPNNYVGMTLAKHVDGYREKSLNFTFLDYVNITSKNINLYNLSIEAWVKMPFYKPSTPYHYSLVAKEGDRWNASIYGDYDFDWFFTTPDSTNMSSLGFSYTYSGGKCGLIKFINDTITNIMDNNWHHLAFTFDSTSSKGVFYLDGNKFYESVGCGPLVMYPNNTRIGQMIGNMDEVKIYNKVINYSNSTFSTSDNITVDVDIKNTGLNQQTQWFAGVEFWKVNNTANPWNTRSQGVYTYYNGTDKSRGNQQGVSGANCSLISDPNGNGYLDPGETIRVRCWVPASYYGSTTGNQRIMFWVHERDLGQDAGNDGNGGNTWWTDALTVIAPSRVMAGIIQGPCPWDVTGDGKINVLDTIKIASKLNTKLGGPGWDPTVDVNKDGKIDVLDLIAVASRLGQTC